MRVLLHLNLRQRLTLVLFSVVTRSLLWESGALGLESVNVTQQLSIRGFSAKDLSTTRFALLGAGEIEGPGAVRFTSALALVVESGASLRLSEVSLDVTFSSKLSSFSAALGLLSAPDATSPAPITVPSTSADSSVPLDQSTTSFFTTQLAVDASDVGPVSTRNSSTSAWAASAARANSTNATAATTQDLARINVNILPTAEASSNPLTLDGAAVLLVLGSLTTKGTNRVAVRVINRGVLNVGSATFTSITAFGGGLVSQTLLSRTTSNFIPSASSTIIGEDEGSANSAAASGGAVITIHNKSKLSLSCPLRYRMCNALCRTH